MRNEKKKGSRRGREKEREGKAEGEEKKIGRKKEKKRKQKGPCQITAVAAASRTRASSALLLESEYCRAKSLFVRHSLK